MMNNTKTKYYVASEEIDVDWDFDPKQRGIPLSLPQVYCTECDTWYYSDFTAPMPEPIPLAIRRFIHALQRRPREPLSILTVPPDEFRTIEKKVRTAYGFPPERRIVPGTDLGPIYLLRQRFEPRWQVYKGYELFFTGKARQAVERLKPPNLLWFPVWQTRTRHWDIWQLAVLGQKRLPAIEGGQWVQCPECWGWSIDALYGVTIRFAVPEEGAQVGDFVCLEGLGLVVSERVVEALVGLGDGSVRGLRFVPVSEVEWRRVPPPSEEELRQWEQMFEEARRLITPPPFE